MADQGNNGASLSIGTDPWSAAIGLVDTGLSAFMQGKTNSLQREMHDDEMRLSQQMFEANMANANEQARINRQFNHDEAQIAREYASVPEQLKRSRSMGVSDWAALGNDGQMVSAQSQIGVNGAFPGMPGIPQLQNPFIAGNFSNNVKSLADSLKSVKEAGKAGADTEKLYSMLGLDIANAKAQLEEKQIANSLAYTWGHLKNMAELKECFARTASLYKQADLFAKQGDLAKAESRLADARKAVEDVTKELRENERDIANKELNSFEEQKRHEWNKMDSEASKNYASAELDRETANRIHELLPSEKELQEKMVEHEGKKIELTEATKNKVLNEALSAFYGQQMDKLTMEQHRLMVHFAERKMEEEWVRLRDFNNMPQLLRWLGNIFGAVSAGAGAAAIKAGK